MASLLFLPVVLAMPSAERRPLVWPVLNQRSNDSTPTNSASNSTGSNGSDGGGSGNGINVQIWAPLVAIVVLIVALMAISYARKRKLNATIRAIQNTNSTTPATTTTNRTRTAANARPRRNRRTPSQISTRSLPAYMLEPGESELVLVRGEDETEDRVRAISEESDRLEGNDITDHRTPLLESPPGQLEPPPEVERRSHSFDTPYTQCGRIAPIGRCSSVRTSFGT
ncbi:hypothetical protein M422DRAFT_45756 [Sphaerobolus stellatus SS14]|nr:hypothetical protein M422DRAFT_45756 [Sphaerobolus stellatus SS14]